VPDAARAALPVGADGTVVALEEPRVTAVIKPRPGSIYYTGGTIVMRDVPANGEGGGSVGPSAGGGGGARPDGDRPRPSVASAAASAPAAEVATGG
jgi:hypothetical protein